MNSDFKQTLKKEGNLQCTNFDRYEQTSGTQKWVWGQHSSSPWVFMPAEEKCIEAYGKLYENVLLVFT